MQVDWVVLGKLLDQVEQNPNEQNTCLLSSMLMGKQKVAYLLHEPVARALAELEERLSHDGSAAGMARSLVEHAGPFVFRQPQRLVKELDAIQSQTQLDRVWTLVVGSGTKYDHSRNTIHTGSSAGQFVSFQV